MTSGMLARPWVSSSSLALPQRLAVGGVAVRDHAFGRVALDRVRVEAGCGVRGAVRELVVAADLVGQVAPVRAVIGRVVATRPLRGVADGRGGAVERRERDHPDLRIGRIEDAQERVHAFLRVVHVGAVRVIARVEAHRPGAVEHDDDVHRARRARAAGVRARRDVEVTDAEELREPGVRAGRRGHREVVRARRRVAPEAGGRGRRAGRRVGVRDGGEVRGGVRGRVGGCGGLRGGGGRQILGTGERGGVRRALQLALGVVRVSDVDAECANPEQRNQHQRHDRQDLTAVSTPSTHPDSLSDPNDRPATKTRV